MFKLWEKNSLFKNHIYSVLTRHSRAWERAIVPRSGESINLSLCIYIVVFMDSRLQARE